MKWFLTYHIGGDVDTLLFDTLDGVFYELSTFFKLPQSKSLSFWGELEKAMPNKTCVTLGAHTPNHFKVKVSLQDAWAATLSAHKHLPFEATLQSQLRSIHDPT